MREVVKTLVPAGVKRSLLPLISPILLKSLAKKKGLKIKHKSDFIDIVRGDDVIRISPRHLVYLGDIVNSFDYYYSAVVPLKWADYNLVDYSTPRYHDVIGFDKYPILFPAFSEPLITTTQYLTFANLSAGMTVLDLGAYSGLTSIVFSQAVGEAGTVVAVDADAQNIECIKRNFSNFHRYSNNKRLLQNLAALSWAGRPCHEGCGTGILPVFAPWAGRPCHEGFCKTLNKIFFLEGAVWKDSDGITFASEGNMGSSATSILGNSRGSHRKVPSFTLFAIADRFNLSRVDFIKCDIEGAESVIFSDHAFFQRFSPRIIIEPHIVNGAETTEKCISDLTAYGYFCKKIVQKGVALPLIKCSPPKKGNKQGE